MAILLGPKSGRGDLHPIDAFVTHDERQAAAARLAGLRTAAPGT